MEHELAVIGGEKEGGREKISVWDQEIQTTMYKIDEQQENTVPHREYSQCFVITLYGIQSLKISNPDDVYLKLTSYCKSTMSI